MSGPDIALGRSRRSAERLPRVDNARCARAEDERGQRCVGAAARAGTTRVRHGVTYARRPLPASRRRGILAFRCGCHIAAAKNKANPVEPTGIALACTESSSLDGVQARQMTGTWSMAHATDRVELTGIEP